MRTIAQIISYIALIVLVAAPILFYSAAITLERNKSMMLIATIVWFITAIYWMGKEKESAS